MVAANTGLDLVMPEAALWNGSLSMAAQNGSLPQSRLDDMATRILAAWYLLGMDSPSYPAKGVGMPQDLNAPHKLVNAIDPASKRTLLQSAIEGHVLVKNINGALPLKKPLLLSLFGCRSCSRNDGIPTNYEKTMHMYP